MSRKYTDAEKAAYYKKLAQQNKKSTYTPKKTYTKKKTAATTGYTTRYKSNAASKPAPKKEPGYISAAGSMLGNLVHPIAGFLGGKLGHLVEQVTGFGDYKVESNSILKGGMSPPQVVNAVDKGGVIIRHREYLGDIKATQAFTLQSFLIQPGLADTFPWLSQIANSYEQYRLRGVLFEFKSTSSDALLSSSTSTALGSVSMSTDYDVADNPPSSLRQMLNFEYSCSSKPSCSFIHPIECKKALTAQSMLYTRSTAVPAGFDQRLYDFARFNIATEGMQADGGVLGQLWVTYEVELYKQQFNYVGLTDHFRFSAISSSRPLGSAIGLNLKSGGTIGGTIDPATGAFYLFPQDYSEGKYLVVYASQGASATVSAASMTPTNGILLNYFTTSGGADASVSNGAPIAGATQTTSVSTWVVQITSQGCNLSFSISGNSPTAPNGGDLFITRIADSIGLSNYLD